MRKHTSGLKSEENNTSRVDISCFGILASSLDEFRRSVELGSSADNSSIIGKVRKVEISNLEVVIFTEQEVFELEVHMRNTIVVEVLQSFDQLSEVGSDELVINVLVVVHDEVKEVTVGSEFHNSVRNLLAASLGDSFSFLFNVVSSDDIGVVDERESGLVLEVSVGLAVGIREDLHGIVLLGNLGIDQVNWEFGFVQGLDDTDVSKSFSVISANHGITDEVGLLVKDGEVVLNVFQKN